MVAQAQLSKYVRRSLILIVLWACFILAYLQYSFRVPNVHLDFHLTPSPPPPLDLEDDPQRESSSSSSSFEHSMHVLNTSLWGQFDPSTHGLDLVGFGHRDWISYNAWCKWQELTLQYGSLSREKNHPFKKFGGYDEREWRNVTGVMHGDWALYTDKTGTYLNSTKPATAAMDGVENEGNISLRFEERPCMEIEVEESPDEEDEFHTVWPGIRKDNALVREIAATMTFQNESASGSGAEVRIYGVHWPRIGVLVMTTTSDKLAGIFGLPHVYSMTGGDFATSRQLLAQSIRKAWEASEEQLVYLDRTRPITRCEYVVFVQVHPPQEGDTTTTPINCPSRAELWGAIWGAPELQISALVFSPNCGLVLTPKRPPINSNHDCRWLPL